MFRKNRIVTSLLFACMLCFCLASIASAHAALAESAGGTLVKFMFSDGTTVKGARIIVYDANQEQIGKGKVDKEGIFDYAEYAGTAAALYMNDGEGHSVTYEIPADAEQAAATEAATEKQTEATVTEAVTEKQTEDLEEEKPSKTEKKEKKEKAASLFLVCHKAADRADACCAGRFWILLFWRICGSDTADAP